jgi:hypothetical protein
MFGDGFLERVGLHDRSFIDANSGDIRLDKSIFGLTYSRKIVSTRFAEYVRDYGLAQPNRRWQPVTDVSVLNGTKADCLMTGAESQCRIAGGILDGMPKSPGKRIIIARYLALLRSGDVDGMMKTSNELTAGP